MSAPLDFELAAAVKLATDWASKHPGRDSLDAATAAVYGTMVRQGEEVFWTNHAAQVFGQSRWPEFLRAVREALDG